MEGWKIARRLAQVGGSRSLDQNRGLETDPQDEATKAPPMKAKPGNWVLIGLALIVVLCFGSVLVVTASYRSHLGDMLEVYAPRFGCRNLLPVDQVERVLEDQGQLIRQIEGADSYVEVIVERPEKCLDRGYFLILHATELGRVRIEEIIGGKFFFAFGRFLKTLRMYYENQKQFSELIFATMDSRYDAGMDAGLYKSRPQGSNIS